MNIPLKIIYENEEVMEVTFLKKEDIILPVKPVFADKILNGTKKESGITDELNKVAQNKNQRLIDGEEEKEERMRLGQDIEPYYIGESRRNGFPYDCFFEWEYEMVETGLNAKDTLDGTLRIIQCAREYALANEKLDANTRLKFFNKNHSKFWGGKVD